MAGYSGTPLERKLGVNPFEILPNRGAGDRAGYARGHRNLLPTG